MLSFHQKFSSPLKIILSGEHSVVYSKNAIAAAINLRYNCEIHELHEEPSNFCVFFNDKLIQTFAMKNLIRTFDEIYDDDILEYNVFKEKIQNNKSFLSECNDKDLFYVYFCLFIENFQNKPRDLLYEHFANKSWFIRISSKVPDLTGIGSSASYLSCITACLLVK